LVLKRLEGDPSKVAGAIRIAAHGVHNLARLAAFTVCTGIAAGTYMYLATNTSLPLQDARLASLDQALGFDWLEFLAVANSNPAISWVLVAAYHSALPQMLALYLLLCFGGRERRLSEFLALLSVTSVAVGALMLLVPAAGAYAHFRPPSELFDGFSTHAGMWHYETLMRLRTQAAPLLDFSKMEGLVTFPSFHTVLAIATAYAFRGFRFLALPAVILNGIVIVSTLPEGGHFLVDVIAGAVIAAVGIALVRWEQAGWGMKYF
jgi:membrane-associated phospholipid phosphatase